MSDLGDKSNLKLVKLYPKMTKLHLDPGKLHPDMP